MQTPTPMAVKRMSATPMSGALTPATPPLVRSPASSISSAASIASFDLDDGGGTIQVAGTSEALSQKFSGNLDVGSTQQPLHPVSQCVVCMA